MSQPLQLGLVSPQDFMSSELDVAVDRFTRGDDRVDLIVFMNPDATEDEIAAAKASIETISFATIPSFVDKRQALEEFRDRFSDSIDVLASVSLADMPTSFRISFDEMDSEALRSAPADFEGQLGRTLAIFDVVASPALDLAPRTLDSVTLSALVLEIPLQPQLQVFMNPSSTAKDLAEIETLIEATGARFVVYDKARTFAEFQAQSSQATGFDEDDMTPSIRAEQAPGLHDVSDMLPIEMVFRRVGPNRGEPLVGDLQRRYMAELISHPAARRALEAAGKASSDQQDVLKQLASDLDDVEERYELASDLRDLLASECGQDVNVSDMTRPLHDMMDTLRDFEAAGG